MNQPVLQQAATLLDLGDMAVDHRFVLPLLEQRLWAEPSPRIQALYADFCREMGQAGATHHGTMVVVPVADRPRQLRHCLESLLGAQRRFGYPARLQLLVVEDSLDPANRRAHRMLVDEMDRAGLDAYHLGVEEQWGVLERWQEGLPLFLGKHLPDQLGHKGASVTRNIAKLWLARHAGEDTLFHFIDSDQTFHLDERGGQPHFLLDHFGHIDRLFREHDLEVLTGKVIGDPPVSPAVMAGTLLQDLLEILDRALPELDAPCSFHGVTAGAGHGAYHDMARLFGLDQAARDFEYACPLPTPHSHRQALADLGGRLGRFFDGEHPTRITPFTPTAIEQSLSPARTVYTGNYVLNRAGLRHGIPFANLKLRMAGPTLGRLLQADLGAVFAQANLPLRHRRTESSSGRAEFRPGVQHGSGVDLSGEYRRQFAGDLMLFSVKKLVETGYPDVLPSVARLLPVLDEVEAMLLDEYRSVRQEVGERLIDLGRRLEANTDSRYLRGFRDFAIQVQNNFDNQASAVRSIEDARFRDQWKSRIAQALRAYPQQQASWAAAVT